MRLVFEVVPLTPFPCAACIGFTFLVIFKTSAWGYLQQDLAEMSSWATCLLGFTAFPSCCHLCTTSCICFCFKYLLDNSFSKHYQIILLTKYLPLLKFSVSYPFLAWWGGGGRLCYICVFQKRDSGRCGCSISGSCCYCSEHKRKPLYSWHAANIQGMKRATENYQTGGAELLEYMHLFCTVRRLINVQLSSSSLAVHLMELQYVTTCCW